MIKLRGIAASPGIAVGPVHFLDRRRVRVPRVQIEAAEVEGEVGRFRAAVEAADRALMRIRERLLATHGGEHTAILEAHQLMVRDEHLVGATVRRITDERINAEWALRKSVEEIKSALDSVEDDYFRERRSDVDFVGDRILRRLLGIEESTSEFAAQSIVVAHDLSPADVALLYRARVAGLATDLGGGTSHTAILSRSLGLPAVLGLGEVTQHVTQNMRAIVDGLRGAVILDPSEEELRQAKRRARRWTATFAELDRNRDLPAVTPDGVRVALMANLELPEEVDPALHHGAEGIGLFRTEFLYLSRAEAPSEEDHYQHARHILEKLGGRPATFRTYDLGSDKVASTPVEREPNPALGLRSIRLCLRERGMFKTQLRGLLRASVHGSMRILFPMISGLGEMRDARSVLAEARAELVRERVPVAEVPVGAMVEMPSAVLIADLLARECDFLSIGTNDLTQYALATDRGNEQVGYLYRPLHPAILRAIRTVTEAGHAARIPVAMCGEVASDPLAVPVLLALGLDELSMNAASIPIVKSAVRSVSAADSREVVHGLWEVGTPEEVEAMLRAYMARVCPTLVKTERAARGDG
jgi:phosphoenolpyruvate-protein phosphotransferase (PTS system enzyme I)